jgi:hypothetical protein
MRRLFGALLVLTMVGAIGFVTYLSIAHQMERSRKCKDIWSREKMLRNEALKGFASVGFSIGNMEELPRKLPREVIAPADIKYLWALDSAEEWAEFIEGNSSNYCISKADKIDAKAYLSWAPKRRPAGNVQSYWYCWNPGYMPNYHPLGIRQYSDIPPGPHRAGHPLIGDHPCTYGELRQAVQPGY